MVTEEALERGTGDTSAPERPMDPIGHLGPVVDDERADRPGDRSVGLDDALQLGSSRIRDMWTRKACRSAGSSGGEGSHPDRLWMLHLLVDRIEITSTSGRGETFTCIKPRPVEELVGYFSGTLRLSAKRLTSSVCSW